MLVKLFLGFSLLGAEWVLYVLILLSIFSVTILFERSFFYKSAQKGIEEFRKSLRDAVNSGEWDRALSIARDTMPLVPPPIGSKRWYRPTRSVAVEELMTRYRLYPKSGR